MRICLVKSGIVGARGVGFALSLFVTCFVFGPFLSPALKAQTKTTPPFEIQVEAWEIPEGYGLRNVLLMNPGDMERFGIKGGETVRVCNKEGSGSNDCVTVRVEYGAGVVSGSVMMDIYELNALRLSPGDRFTMELTPL